MQNPNTANPMSGMEAFNLIYKLDYFHRLMSTLSRYR